ncbi:MAG: hypothetical protein COB73_01590 [Flavobacteriaceae bacterium]|nr:MAG: hypothetical protein COB73_01590 [Flavobacteriaceae bacterium]
MSNNLDLNYIIANISIENSFERNLFNDGLFVKIFKMSDFRATPEGYFEGTDEVLSSYLVSVSPDGNYVSSKLYKIKGILNPKIIDVIGLAYPTFQIKIEYGAYNNRKIELLEFD